MPHAESALCNPGLLGQVFDWVRRYSNAGNDLATLSHEELRHIGEDLSLAPSQIGGHLPEAATTAS